MHVPTPHDLQQPVIDQPTSAETTALDTDSSDPLAIIQRLRRPSMESKPAGSDDAPRPASDVSVRILLVDQNLTRASILEEGLREAGYTKVTVVRDMQSLMRRIVELEPDVIVIDLENPNRDVLEQMFQVSRCVARPVAMFVDRSDAATIGAAIEAGVSAYIVDGLKKERVRLREELDRTKQALEERKLVDRAKGILMRKRGVSEEEAYALMRKASMNDNRRLGEIAQSIITAAQLLK
jgi:two-component system, response regulator / RNA-binding antiterminator